MQNYCVVGDRANGRLVLLSNNNQLRGDSAEVPPAGLRVRFQLCIQTELDEHVRAMPLRTLRLVTILSMRQQGGTRLNHEGGRLRSRYSPELGLGCAAWTPLDLRLLDAADEAQADDRGLLEELTFNLTSEEEGDSIRLVQRPAPCGSKTIIQDCFTLFLQQ